MTGLWQNRTFRLLITASGVSGLGAGVTTIAFPWFAASLTRDPFLIGLVAAGPTLPTLLFTLAAGVLTDRLDRRRTMIFCDAARAGLTLAVAGLALSGMVGLPVILTLALVAVGLGTALVMHDNVAQSVLPGIVDKDHLERANAALWSLEQLTAQFLGPPVAGALIGFGIAWTFGLDAAMLALSAALTMRLVLPKRPPVPHQSFGLALKEGMAWLWAHVLLRRLAMVLAGYNFLSRLIWGVMVLYVQDVLRLSALGYGVLMSAVALGGLAGALVAPWLIRRIGNKASLMLSIGGFTLSSSVLIWTTSPVLAGAALMGDAFTGLMWNVVTVSYRQRHIPDALLGRTNAAYRFIGTGTLPLGALAGGALVSLAAPLGPAALQLPFAVATLGGLAMLVFAAMRLQLD